MEAANDKSRKKGHQIEDPKEDNTEKHRASDKKSRNENQIEKPFSKANRETREEDFQGNQGGDNQV